MGKISVQRSIFSRAIDEPHGGQTKRFPRISKAIGQTIGRSYSHVSRFFALEDEEN